MANLLKTTIMSTLAYNAMWISNGFDHIAVAYTCIRLLISKMCEKISCNPLKLNQSWFSRYIA